MVMLKIIFFFAILREDETAREIDCKSSSVSQFQGIIRSPENPNYNFYVGSIEVIVM